MKSLPIRFHGNRYLEHGRFQHVLYPIGCPETPVHVMHIFCMQLLFPAIRCTSHLSLPNAMGHASLNGIDTDAKTKEES